MLTTYIIIFIIFILLFLAVSTLMCIAASRYIKSMYIKRNRQRISEDRRQYQQHIDDLTAALFPTHTNHIPTIHTVPDPHTQDIQYTEAKRKMVADIRTYFNQRKINAGILKVQASDRLAPVNPSAGSYGDRGSYEELTFTTPPSIERLME